MPMTKPDAIATMPTDRAINALCCKPGFAIVGKTLVRDLLHAVDKVVRGTETVSRDAAELTIM